MKIIRMSILGLTLVLLACAQTPIQIPTPPALTTNPQPRELVEKFSLLQDPAIPSTQTTANYTLTHTPNPGTVLSVSFSSSQLGGNYSGYFSPTGPDMKQIVVTLPTYRPFTSSDVITVFYKTLEP